MNFSPRRFYRNTDSLERAANVLLKRHGSPEDALKAIEVPLIRMHDRSLAWGYEYEDEDRRHHYGDSIRYSWRVDVKILLLRLERERVKQQGPDTELIQERIDAHGGRLLRTLR